MKFVHAILFLSVLCAVVGFAATTAVKSTTKKSTGAKVTPKAGTKSHVAATAKGRKPAGPPAPRRQLTPTSERYREIQQALVNKGYLQGEPTGVWDADSIAAMQHFQSDQKQTPTGKITAAALIGLGLGAKSAGAPEAPPLGGHPAAAGPAVPQGASGSAASQ